MVESHNCVLRSLFIIMIVLLPGCGLIAATSMSIRGPKDVRFVSLAVVDLHDLTDVQRRHIKAQNKSYNKLLRLQFASDTTDLVQYGVDNGLITPEFKLCDGEGNLLDDHTISASYIMHDWIVLGQSSYAREHAAAMAAERKTAKFYDAYFNIKSMRPMNSESMQTPSAERFNLATHPHDVCFQIIGGDMWTGYGFRSNMIVISNDQIAEALRSEK